MFSSCISDILLHGVDPLEHWISTPAIKVRIPSGTWDFFQTMSHLLFTNFHIRKQSRCEGNKKDVCRSMHYLCCQKNKIPAASVAEWLRVLVFYY